MTSEQRDDLMIQVNRSFRDGGDYARRDNLYTIGESLITEWEDLDFKITQDKVKLLKYWQSSKGPGAAGRIVNRPRLKSFS